MTFQATLGRSRVTLAAALMVSFASIGFAQHWLAAAHRSVLAQGGQTFFLGDGALRYRPEQVLEAYYLFAPTKGVAVTFDAQRITNPGYNADRGPASFFGLRLHIEN